MFENHSSIKMYTACVSGKRGSVTSGGMSRFLHPAPPPMSACLCLPYMEWLQLQDLWLVVGHTVLPVGHFFHPLVVSFSSQPTTLSSMPSAPVGSHVDIHAEWRIKLIHVSTTLTKVFLGVVCWTTFLIITYMHSTLNRRILWRNTCSHLKHQQWLYTGW